mmetsp:Transcript_107775/g.197921  ORF Transcript_107775/g.197921 Transcript_107775/m.197921 type:complete len:312 (+) Transcript_107775:1321-2256(+)
MVQCRLAEEALDSSLHLVNGIFQGWIDSCSCMAKGSLQIIEGIVPRVHGAQRVRSSVLGVRLACLADAPVAERQLGKGRGPESCCSKGGGDDRLRSVRRRCYWDRLRNWRKLRRHGSSLCSLGWAGHCGTVQRTLGILARVAKDHMQDVAIALHTSVPLLPYVAAVKHNDIPMFPCDGPIANTHSRTWVCLQNNMASKLWSCAVLGLQPTASTKSDPRSVRMPATLHFRPRRQQLASSGCCLAGSGAPALRCLWVDSRELNGPPALVGRVVLAFSSNALEVQLVEQACIHHVPKLCSHDIKMGFQNLCKGH